MCLQGEQALCKRQLLSRLRRVSLPLRPIDGDAALPVVEPAHHDLTLPGLWEIKPPKIKKLMWSQAAGVDPLWIEVCFVVFGDYYVTLVALFSCSSSALGFLSVCCL